VWLERSGSRTAFYRPSEFVLLGVFDLSL